MADHFQVVSNAPGFFSRLSDSIKGIFIGILLFVLAFPLLWWGEHRKNEAEFVDEAKAVISESLPAAIGAGTLIKTTGVISTEEAINDDEFLATDGEAHYLALQREVQMYSWKENKKTEKQGDKEITTYDYVKEWTSSPNDSKNFKEGSGHQNPVMAVSDEHFQASDAEVGMIPLDAGSMTFYGMSDLPVTDEMANEDEELGLMVGASKIYLPYEHDADRPRDPMKTPKVGDLRIGYSYYPAGKNGAVVGNWDGNKIVSHIYGGDEKFFGAFRGTLDEFRAELNLQYRIFLWVVRAGAFLMLWIGLNLILGPMLMLLDSIPILGSVGRIAVSIVTFGLAFVLWSLTIILANLWLVLLVGAALTVGIMMYVKKKSAAAPATPAISNAA